MGAQDGAGLQRKQHERGSVEDGEATLINEVKPGMAASPVSSAASPDSASVSQVRLGREAATPD